MTLATMDSSLTSPEMSLSLVTAADYKLETEPSEASIPRRIHATEDDWRRHRERITHLYRTNRLRDVIAFMEANFRFFATQRMYKARFKKWGLPKYVTKDKVCKLVRKVTQAQQRRRILSASRGWSGDETVELDLGEDLDVLRIQRYIKRNRVGLRKLRPACGRSLDLIKSLSVDCETGSSGRGKVSIHLVKLDQENGQETRMSPPPNFILESQPDAELPDGITDLLLAFIDNHFDSRYPFAAAPTSQFAPKSSPEGAPLGHAPFFTSPLEPVSRQDEVMLDFVLKFRVAHILLGEGLTSEGVSGIDKCLDLLVTCVEQAQTASPMDTRPATCVILWAFSAAWEIMSDFKHLKRLATHMLFHRMTAVCAHYQPTLAELASRMAQLSTHEQVATLQLARRSISCALFAGESEQGPALKTYWTILDVAASSRTPEDSFQALQTVSNGLGIQGSPVLDAWVQTRIALAAPGTSPLYPSLVDPCSVSLSPSWDAQGNNKIVAVLGRLAAMVDWHRAAGNWQLAEQLEFRSASVAEMAWGFDNDAKWTWMGGFSIPGSPEQMASSLALLELEPSMSHTALPGDTSRMDHLAGEDQEEFWKQQ